MYIYHSDPVKYHQSELPEIEGFGGNCCQCTPFASLDLVLDSALLVNGANEDLPLHKYTCFFQ